MTFRSYVKLITPPIVWKILQYSKAQFVEISDFKIQGEEKKSNWYDDNISDLYYDHYSTTHYYPVWSVIADRIARQTCNSVLDIGCGTGQFASLLKDHGIDCYCGIDFSKKRIIQAKKNVPSYSFHVEDAFETDIFKDHDYKIVVCMEVLEHIEYDIELIKRIPPGKIFYGTVPNFGSLSHVRYFDSIQDVSMRYKECFNNFKIKSYIISNSVFYLFEGETR